MSWIVQNLLNNRTHIRQKTNIHEKEYRNFNFYKNYELGRMEFDDNLSVSDDDETSFRLEFGYDDPSIESDEFNDLMMVEKAIEELYKKGNLTEKDLLIIEYASNGGLPKDGKTLLKRNRKSLSKDFQEICNRIAFYLGGYFTDDGYVSYMEDKYNLNFIQVQKIINFMNSRFKNKIIRSLNGYE